MLVPEIILYNTVKSFLQLVKADYIAASDKTETIIHDLFAVDNNNTVLQLENLVYFDQAATLFSRTDEHPRKCQAYIGYNQQKAFLPAVHILLPQETHGRYDSIGQSLGEVETIVDINGGVTIDTLTKTYRATFDLLITSDNTTEVLLTYYLLKSMLVYSSTVLELAGLHNFVTTGMDVQLDQQYAPPNIFHRTLRVEFDYQSQTKIRNAAQIANSLKFMICNNIGSENAPPKNSNNQILINNYVVNITKNQQSGVVGYIKFTNHLTDVTTTLNLDLTGQSNDYSLSNNLAAARYTVEINLLNFQNYVTGSVNDGGIWEYAINTNGTFSFNRFYDTTAVGTTNLIIDLNFF